MIIQRSSLQKGLPKGTNSLCPECKKIIPATIYEKDGKVMMKKSCEKHGDFEDVYWSDIDMYLKAEQWSLTVELRLWSFGSICRIYR